MMAIVCCIDQRSYKTSKCHIETRTTFEYFGIPHQVGIRSRGGRRHHSLYLDQISLTPTVMKNHFYFDWISVQVVELQNQFCCIWVIISLQTLYLENRIFL